VCLDALWDGSSRASALSCAQIRADLAYLRPAAVVAVTGRGSRLGQILASVFGQCAVQVGRTLGWRR